MPKRPIKNSDARSVELSIERFLVVLILSAADQLRSKGEEMMSAVEDSGVLFRTPSSSTEEDVQKLASAAHAAGQHLIETSEVLADGVRVSDDRTTALIDGGLLAGAARSYEAFLRKHEEIAELELPLAHRMFEELLRARNTD